MEIKLIREKIKKLREEQGLTQEQLAEKAGLCPKFIGCIERGTRGFSIETFFKIARALNVHPHMLTPSKEEIAGALKKQRLAPHGKHR